MIWKRLGPFRCFSESDGTAKETTLAPQDFGLQVAEVQYCVKVLGVSSATAQVGVKHYDSPDLEQMVSRSLATPITVQTPSSELPALLARIARTRCYLCRLAARGLREALLDQPPAPNDRRIAMPTHACHG